MNSILMDLYLKYLDHYDNDMSLYLHENHSKYNTIQEELLELEEAIYNALDKEKKRIFDETIYQRIDLEDIKISYAFSQGFILATKIILEVNNTKIKK